MDRGQLSLCTDAPGLEARGLLGAAITTSLDTRRTGFLSVLSVVMLAWVFLCPTANAQTNEWAWMGGSVTGGSFGVYGTLGTPAPGNAPGGRSQPVSWTDSKGNLWLFGGNGFDSAGNPGYLNDLWEVNPSSNEWTWVGGSSTLSGDFSSGAGAYGTLGMPAEGNIPPGRSGAVSWIDAKGNLWLFGGFSYSSAGYALFNDMWEFNPTTNEWAWMSGSNMDACWSECGQSGVYGTLGTAAAGNVPGARDNAISWTDSKGNLWLFGGAGYDSAGNQGNLNDLWKFSPSTSEWTWMSGADTVNQPGVPGTLRTPAPGNVPAARNGAVSWIDSSGNFWLFGGVGIDGPNSSIGSFLNDLWEFNPTTNEWTWMSGISTTQTYTAGQPGVYGSLQTPAADNVPGSRTGTVSWTDNKGNLWMFGGDGYDSTDTQGMLNDLWEFNPSTDQWTWMNGSEWCDPLGVYGALQTPALGDAPGGRYDGVSWTDSKGNFWLFGGIGYDGDGTSGFLSDLWEFQPNTGGLPVTATPTIEPCSGTYTSWQTVTITDTTPGATVDYLINGITPASAYTGPIIVSSLETIEAIAGASGYANSNIASANYVANLPRAATPTFSLAPGTYAVPQTLTISDTTSGATIYYAIGAVPTSGSTVYTGPIAISSTETVEAIAVSDNYLNSAIATAAYIIGPNPSAEWTWMGGSSSIPANCPSTSNCGQPGWYGTFQTPAATNVPGGRWGAVSWTDSRGDLWLFGGVGNQGSLNDLWEFNPSTGEWAWMAGSSTAAYSPLAGSGQPGVYGTLDTPAAGNTPGSRFNAAGWTDNKGNLWLFGGYGFDANGAVDDLNDLWEFDPSTNEWTWMGGDSTLSCLAVNECSFRPGVYGTLGSPAAGNTPGGRAEATRWTDHSGNFWIYGGYGADSRGIGCNLDDLWEFYPSTNEWAWMGGNKFCSDFDAGIPGVYGALDVPAVGNLPWSLVSTASWTDSSGNLWLFGGLGVDATATGYFLNDMWEFYPAIDEWAWTSANSVSAPGGNGSGTYGTMGVWSPGNIPGERDEAADWTDSNGNFWLFGGFGITFTSPLGVLNDLWEFKPTINEWVWMGGSSTVICLAENYGICVSYGQLGVYGALGTPAPGNVPGARDSATTWTDSRGNLWLFGGSGYDAQGAYGYLNDLWQYSLTATPTVRPPSPAATPTFSLAAGTYPSPQTMIISDQTPGATIYYLINGITPASAYTGPITVSSSETVGAIAVASGYSSSAEATAAYIINLPPAATPTLSVPTGTYTTAQTVTISDSTVGATIHYTTNGTTPTTSSPVYSGPITVTSTETLEAIATASGYSTSAVASAAYTINLSGPDFSVTASPSSLTVTAGQSGTTTISVMPLNGFNTAVSFSCSGLLSGTSCSFSPATVTPSGTAVSTTLTLTASTSASNQPPSPLRYMPVAALALTLCFVRFRNFRRHSVWILCVAATLSLLCLSACSGEKSSTTSETGPAPTPESGMVTVTATSGSLSHSAGLSVSVN